jgi:hypothetical protein
MFRPLGEQLSASHVTQLLRDGYTQVDVFLGAQRALALRGEMDGLIERNLMWIHKFDFGGRLFVKPNIYELDFHAAAGSPAAAMLPEFGRLFAQQQQLINALNRQQPALRLRPAAADSVGPACAALSWSCAASSAC